MTSHTDDAIAAASAQRDQFCEQCFQLLYKISRQPSSLKLLGLAFISSENASRVQVKSLKPAG